MAYLFDEVAGRYRDASTGRFVAASTVRGALDNAIDASAEAMRQASERLRSGALSLDQWFDTMTREIKNVHLSSAALAKGGFAQMTQADYGSAGGIVRREYGFLRRFGEQIASGEQPLDGRFLQRAEQYVKAGRETYHRTERREKEKRGFTEERSILNPADHCDECVAEAARGWVSIGAIVPIGNRICRSNCKCEIEYQ